MHLIRGWKNSSEKKSKKIAELKKDVEQHEAFREVILSHVKKPCNAMNSFNYSCMHQAKRQNIPSAFFAGFTEFEIIDALITANLFGILTVIVIFDIARNEALAQSEVRRGENFFMSEARQFP